MFAPKFMLKISSAAEPSHFRVNHWFIYSYIYIWFIHSGLWGHYTETWEGRVFFLFFPGTFSSSLVPCTSVVLCVTRRHAHGQRVNAENAACFSEEAGETRSWSSDQGANVSAEKIIRSSSRHAPLIRSAVLTASPDSPGARLCKGAGRTRRLAC